ncbi:hypothetical protein ACFV9C_32485 [Kribbella sp. NPDC059898]|uniref:hypothetical protein n=1 Tax=Kribbella sp. NPDC059898 TaxID=3346995 RepID=UPI00364FAA73
MSTSRETADTCAASRNGVCGRRCAAYSRTARCRTWPGLSSGRALAIASSSTPALART